MESLICLELRGIPLALTASHDDIAQRWQGFYHGLNYPIRWITMTEPFDLSAAIQRLETDLRELRSVAIPLFQFQAILDRGDPITDQVLMTLPDAVRELMQSMVMPHQRHDPAIWQSVCEAVLDTYPVWRVPLLEEYRDHYHELMADRDRPLRRVRHFVLAFPPSARQSSGVARDLRYRLETSFETPVWESRLPSLFGSPYRYVSNYLAPENPTHPLWKFLTSYDFKQEWSAGSPWEDLFALPIAQMALCLSIDPVSERWAQLRTTAIANDARNKIESLEQSGGRQRDAKTLERGDAALQVEERLQKGQESLHYVQAFLGFAAETEQQLREFEEAIRATIEKQKFVFLLDGKSVQPTLAQMFSPTATAKLPIAPLKRPYTMISQQVADVTPAGLYSPVGTEGIIWGLDEHATPIMMNPFMTTHGMSLVRTPAHLVGLGKTGSGKTHLINHLLRRWATIGARIISIEPQSHSRKLIDSLNGKNVDPMDARAAQRFAITPRDRLNPFDSVLFVDDQGREPELAEQIDHVLSRFSVLLGRDKTITTGDGHTLQTFVPREWADLEDTILSLAIRRVYAPYADHMVDLPADETPTIHDLLHELRLLRDEYRIGSDECEQSPEMVAMTTQLILLFRGLVTKLGDTIGGHTTIHWDFDEYAVLAYGLDGLQSARLQTYFFDHIFASINRYVRRPFRDRSIPIIVCFDEFAWSFNKIPGLLRFAADASKTWRTMGAALWVWDQDLHLYVGVTDALCNPYLKSVWDQAALRVTFKQTPEVMQRLRSKLSYLTPLHGLKGEHARLGEFLLMWERGQAQDGLPANLVWYASMQSTATEKETLTGS